MKVAVCSTGNSIDSDVSNVFGRCAFFIIAEIENNEIIQTKAIKNLSADQKGGAGISAAKKVVEQDVNSVITQNLGPRAADVLNQFNIKCYKASGTIKKALQDLIKNNLEMIK